jgi:hypothetical protein
VYIKLIHSCTAAYTGAEYPGKRIRYAYEYYPAIQYTYRYLIDRRGDRDVGPLIRNTLTSQIVSQRARHAVDIAPPVGRSSAMVT